MNYQTKFSAGFVAPPVMLVDGTIIDAAALPRNSRQGRSVSVSSEDIASHMRSPQMRSAPGSSTGQPPVMLAGSFADSRGLAVRSEALSSVPSHSLGASQGASGSSPEQDSQGVADGSSAGFDEQPLWYHPIVNEQGISFVHNDEQFPGKLFLKHPECERWHLCYKGVLDDPVAASFPEPLQCCVPDSIMSYILLIVLTPDPSTQNYIGEVKYT